MVYHFFSKWKDIGAEVKSLGQLIRQAEKVYKIKVQLWHRIWYNLYSSKIDDKSVKKLSKIYKHKEYSIIYELIEKEIVKVISLNLLDRAEVNQFYELVTFLVDKSRLENSIAIPLLEELLSGKIPETASLYKIKGLLKEEAHFMKIEDEHFRKIEDVFIQKTEPGSGTGGYILVIDAIKKGLVTVIGNKLNLGSKELQGVVIHHNKLILKGDHYATLQNARWIEGDAFVEPSTHDPYSYFVERGKFAGWSSEDIQRALGISEAEAVVSLVIEVFPEQLYLKS